MANNSLSPESLLEGLGEDPILEQLAGQLDVPRNEIADTLETLKAGYRPPGTGNPEDSTTRKIEVDGGSRGNPGHGGAGAVLRGEDDEIIRTKSEFLGKSVTNNEAEYRALLLGLEMVPTDTRSLKIFMDSELIVRQIQGDYQVKSERLRPYFERVERKLDEFEDYTIEHIPREDNKRADELANQAIDKYEQRQSVR